MRTVGVSRSKENDVRVLRDTVCASQSKWVEFVARQQLRSRLVLSHIRKATDGAIAIKNTQPFSRWSCMYSHTMDIRRSGIMIDFR